MFFIIEKVYGKTPGTYIEAGANDGVSYSNTLRLENDLGWSGLLIEPGIPAFELLQKNRPRNLNLNQALVGSAQTKILSGTFSSGSLLSSAHSELKYRDVAKLQHKFRGVARLRKTLGLKPKLIEIEVPATTLAAAIKHSGFNEINLLSLDVEGMELDVLLGLESYRPEIIIVETREHNNWQLAELLLNLQYTLCGEISSHMSSKIPAEHKDFVWVISKNSNLVTKVLNSIQSLDNPEDF